MHKKWKALLTVSLAAALLLPGAIAEEKPLSAYETYLATGEYPSLKDAYQDDFLIGAAVTVLGLMTVRWQLRVVNLPEEAVGLGGALSLCAAMRIAGSRTSALCSILLLGFVLFRMLFRNRRENNAYSSSISKGFHFLLALSFVIIAAAYCAAMLLYAKGTHVGSVLDLVLSNRLQLTLEILRDQGITAFGSNFPQAGLGGSTVAIGPEKYYFLDSSYPLLLIRYGWVLFLAAAALWTKMGLSAYRMKDRKLLYVMTVVAVHALSEHHFPDVQYNMLLVMPFAAIPNREAAAKEKTLPALVRAHPAGAICAAAFLAAFLWGLPLLLSRLRTVFGIRGTDTGFGELKATAWCFLLFLVVTGFCVFLCKTAEGLRKHNGGAWKGAAAAGICLVILAGIAARDSHIIKTASENHDLISEETAEAFQVMLSSAEGKVYTEELPEAVHKHFPGFSRSVLYGDDLARFQNVSVVVSLRDDRICFAKSGFLFTELSPELAVYSNDPSVIKAMEDAGHGWTDYDSAVRTVDLQRLAGFNGLVLSEEGGIILEAGERLRRGPYQDLYAGTYEVSLFLHIDDLETKAGETVCTLYATVLDGPVLTEETVTADCFDENGNATVKLRFETGSIRYLQLPVFSETEQRLEVTGITYQKTHR